MRLRKLSGLALCLMVLFVMGCGSGSDSTSGSGTEMEDSGGEPDNGTDQDLVDGGPDTPGTDPGDGGMDMEPGRCEIEMAMEGEPETEMDTQDSDSDSGMDAGTDDPNDVVDVDNPNSGDSPDDDMTDPIMGEVIFAALDDEETDAYIIHTNGDDAPVIDDDMLTVTVSYGGGCEDHAFTLVAANEFKESSPVQLDFTISHDANEDMCERWIEKEKYEFDLTPVKTRYEAAYPEGDVVFLAFQTPDGSDCDYAGLAYNTDTGSSP